MSYRQIAEASGVSVGTIQMCSQSMCLARTARGGCRPTANRQRTGSGTGAAGGGLGAVWTRSEGR